MICSCRIHTPDPEIVGIQRGLRDEPRLILWNCAEKSTHGIPWSEAPSHVKAAAIEAEIARMRRAV